MEDHYADDPLSSEDQGSNEQPVKPTPHAEIHSHTQRPVHGKGRGSQLRPDNRFTPLQVIPDYEYLEYDEEAQAEFQQLKTTYFVDSSRSIISKNSSPDIPFNYSLNPYRGCAHGCSYCYARPTHEYLGLDAGLDFESRIFVKQDAANLFRDFLIQPSWMPEPIAMSGVTDCYQPCERQFKITRQCLEVACEARQPITIVTKNALILRDLDLLQELHEHGCIKVAISITSLDQALTRVMEPRSSAPQARLNALSKLHAAGIPTHVMTAPMIPGLNDHEMPAILKAAHETGCRSAAFVLLRLPYSVKPVFLEWIHRTHPSQSQKVENYLRSTREGQLYQAEFGKRMKGTGAIADQIQQTFTVWTKKLGFNQQSEALKTWNFRKPQSRQGERYLF